MTTYNFSQKLISNGINVLGVRLYKNQAVGETWFIKHYFESVIRLFSMSKKELEQDFSFHFGKLSYNFTEMHFE